MRQIQDCDEALPELPKMNWRIWADRELRERLIWQGLIVPERERRGSKEKVLELDDVGRAAAYVEIRSYDEQAAEVYARRNMRKDITHYDNP